MPIFTTYYKFDGEEYVKGKDYDSVLRKLKKANDDLVKLESELETKEELLKISTAINNNWVESLKKMMNEEDAGSADLDDCDTDSDSEKEDEIPWSREGSMPFYDGGFKEELIEELEDRHQQDCITINQLHTTIDTLVDRYAKLREMRGLTDNEQL